MDNLYIKITRLSDNKNFELGNSLDWNVAENGLENFGTIDNDIISNDNAITDGATFSGERVQKRDRTIKAIYRSQQNMDVERNKMLSFFNIKSLFRVRVIYGMRDVYADGKIMKFLCDPVHLDRGYLSLTVTFLFANPYWKSTNNFGANIADVMPLIGFPYMVSQDINPVGLTGGKFNFAKKVNLPNNGDIPTFCTAVFTASGKVSNPKLMLHENYVRVIDTLTAGDVISMDFTATPPMIKKNGINFIGHCDRTSQFTKMILELGDNMISYDADDGTEYLSVYIYYNKLYGAI